ncbi:MAG: sigma-70 family RNA polymerase sigma factor [Oscillospiraceae bacterium]|jgi:RNA polymerase sporulation-specific sigma factor|nr:sigma-70 family RNA polymerase sigma factor [Oscillospiraceae bacterium]
MSSLADEKLCALAQSGQSEAEQILAGRYFSMVRAITRPYFLAGGDSEDLTQEGMIGLLMAMRQFSADKDAAFRTFAGRCIRNRLNNAVKASTRRKHMPLENYISITDGKDAGALAGLCVSGPEDEVLSREADIEAVAALKSRLSGFENRVLGHYLDGLSYQDISERVDRDTKSVDNAIQRIRKKLIT